MSRNGNHGQRSGNRLLVGYPCRRGENPVVPDDSGVPQVRMARIGEGRPGRCLRSRFRDLGCNDSASQRLHYRLWLPGNHRQISSRRPIRTLASLLPILQGARVEGEAARGLRAAGHGPQNFSPPFCRSFPLIGAQSFHDALPAESCLKEKPPSARNRHERTCRPKSKIRPRIARNSFGWTILRNNPFVINGVEQMIEGQAAQRKALNPKRGMGGWE